MVGRPDRKPMTAAQRKVVSLRMKKYWAARRIMRDSRTDARLCVLEQPSRPLFP
jgi:hypothetical protein